MRKLNLGCGFDKREGFLNADHFAECEPDIRLDIESTPWSLRSNAFDYVLMKHVLEHVGSEFSKFAEIMRELHRITAPDGIIEIHVPDYRHPTFWSDPTHVRAFTSLTFQMMSKKQNDIWIARRANYTMLAYVMKVDFEVVSAAQVYDANWMARVKKGELTMDQLRGMANSQLGVVKELQVRLKVVKEEALNPPTPHVPQNVR